MTITSSELLSRSVCAVARGGGSAWSPPQELRAATVLGLVGMRAAALRARLLNSALSVGRPGAYDKFNLLISARMGVGHAGVAIKRSSNRQRTVLGRFIDDGQIFVKNVVMSKRCW